MTESRVPYQAMPMQASMFGPPVAVGDIPARVAYVLSKHPEAQGSYALAQFWYWVEFDGLADVLGSRLDAFRRWYPTATPAKTINNRCGEIQNDIPALEPAEVAAQRQRQARQGRVR